MDYPTFNIFLMCCSKPGKHSVEFCPGNKAFLLYDVIGIFAVEIFIFRRRHRLGWTFAADYFSSLKTLNHGLFAKLSFIFIILLGAVHK